MEKKRNLLFIICVIILIAAAASMIGYKAVQARQEKKYEDLAKEVTAEPVSVPEEEPEESAAAPEAPKPDIPIDFDSLTAQNPDIFAWITIPDTPVDYPLVHRTDGDDNFYLKHASDTSESAPGAIFTQYTHNQDLETDHVTMIYGHYMKKGTMFGSLKYYLEESYRQEHPQITIYTPEHIYNYKVVFAVTYDDRHIMNAFFDCKTSIDYGNFLTSIQTERQLPSWIADPFDVTTDDRMIVLSTCNGHTDQRLLIGAVLTEEQ